MGHSIVETFPALTPILCTTQWANALKGITIENTIVKIWEPQLDRKKRKPISTKQGSFLFTHFGFSGPVILDASRVVSGHEQKKKLQMTCDWLPYTKPAELVEKIKSDCRREGKQSVARLFADVFPKRLWEQLIAAANIDAQARNAELSNAQIESLANQLKSTTFPIQGTLGFEKAEVTAGGVSLKEVSSQTMESKITPGLFFAGEILDLDGPIGGYNFQSAFSTGFVAGSFA